MDAPTTFKGVEASIFFAFIVCSCFLFYRNFLDFHRFLPWFCLSDDLPPHFFYACFVFYFPMHDKIFDFYLIDYQLFTS
jgi:hypothetical protein